MTIGKHWELFESMPKLLLERLKPANSIAEFRSASARRFVEAVALAEAGHRTGAVYLFGYVVEMELKSASFWLAGFGPHQPIRRADLMSVRAQAIRLGVNWVGNLHDITAWADFLVLLRRAAPGLAYAPDIERRILGYARETARRWRESLRYHGNVAYRFELRTMQAAAEWFRRNADQL